MKHLIKHAKKYKKEVVCGPLFKLFEASFELGVPLCMKQMIDVGIGEGRQGYILTMSLVLVLLGVLGLCSTVIAQYFSAKAAVGITSKMKRELFAHIQSLSFSELDGAGTPTLITRMTNDANQVQNGINLTLRLFMRSPFIVFGAMIMAFTIDVKSALIFASVIPALSIVVFGIMLVCIPLYKRVQAKLDELLSLTRENLTGVRVIRAFCGEKSEKARFFKDSEELSNEQERVGRISALMNPLTYVLINLAILILIYVGAIRVEVGILTQGAVIALYNYMSQILVELVKFASLIITITKSVACENRIEKVFELRPSMIEAEDGISLDNISEITFKNVSLTYKNAREPSLEDVSFTAKKGERIGIIGGTGSGKTSLVNLIPRFYDATDGEILVNGKNIKEFNTEKLRSLMGIVPQKAVLFRGTIRENLLWGNPAATDEELYEALTASQSAGFVEEKGLDFEVEQGGRNFSGGQRQRLTIARALVRRPDVLILDDSSSALDFATDAALRSAIGGLSYNPLVFIVSQRTSSIKNADRIIVLDDGRQVGIGTHDELLQSCPTYREIHESQFRREGDAI